MLKLKAHVIVHPVIDFLRQRIYLEKKNPNYYKRIIHDLTNANERGYNPETPSNFPHHSSVMLIE